MKAKWSRCFCCHSCCQCCYYYSGYCCWYLPYQAKAHTYCLSGHWMCCFVRGFIGGWNDVPAYARHSPPRGGINFIVLLQGLTNCTTHIHTLAHKKNTHPRTRHNLKHAFQGTLIGISGKVDVSYLPLLCHSPG